MDCSRLPSLYTARLDQELTAAEQAAFDGHLEACPDCRRQWRLFQNTMDRLQVLEPQPAPGDLLPGILAAVDQQQRQNPASSLPARLLNWWRRQDFSVSMPTAAATVATAMILAVLVKNSMIPWPMPGTLDETATEVSRSAGSVEGLAGERPRLPVPDATLATTSRRSYYPQDYPAGPGYDTVPTHQSPFKAFPGSGPRRPDVLVVFQGEQGGQINELEQLFKECSAQSSWRVGYPHQGMMLLDLPPCELSHLRELLAGKSAAIAPAEALSPDFGRGRETVRVAIRFQ